MNTRVRSLDEWSAIFAEHPDYSIVQLTRKLGCARSTVYFAAVKVGHKFPLTRRDSGEWLTFFEQYPGRTAHELAKLADVSVRSLLEAAKRNGVLIEPGWTILVEKAPRDLAPPPYNAPPVSDPMFLRPSQRAIAKARALHPAEPMA